MHKSNVERRAELVSTVKAINVILSARKGNRYEAVMRVEPGSIDRITIQRHTKTSEQESGAVEIAA